MSPCDCGLVTPTLEQLLAVARNKPLPRIRERRPPPARVSATLKGWMEWRLVNRRGREVAGGEGPNLILDQGLDEIATTALVSEQGMGGNLPTFFPLIRYCAVGTDSTAPDPSQTGLGTEVGRTGNTFATEQITRPSPGVYRLTRFIEFDYSVANGNLTEWGFSSSSSAGSNLFNRALFTDDEGDPDVVTKTEEEKLRVTYTLEVALSPVSLTPGSFDIAGVGTVNGDYMLLGAGAPPGTVDADMRCTAPDLKLFSALARGVVGVVNLGSTQQGPLSAAAYLHASDLSGVAYTNAVSKTSDLTTPVAPRDVGDPRDAYAPGSFTRTGGTWKWDTAYGNLNPIAAVYVQGSYEVYNSGINLCGLAGYAFDIDPGDVFSKDDEHALTIGVPTVSWGRAS